MAHHVDSTAGDAATCTPAFGAGEEASQRLGELAARCAQLESENAALRQQLKDTLAATEPPSSAADTSSDAAATYKQLAFVAATGRGGSRGRHADDAREPLLTPNSQRFVMFPIRHTEAWAMAKKQEHSKWAADEIDLKDDVAHWNYRLSPNEKQFIGTVLAFFAAADGIVTENLAQRFYDEVQTPEHRAFYAHQIAFETVHSETYSMLIEKYITDAGERHALQHSAESAPGISSKAAWVLRWLTSERPFRERIVAFAAVEGILFSASFCAIFWLRKRGLMPGLCHSNELIARDEGLHCDFACLVHHSLDYPLDAAGITDILRSAVDAECDFVRNALPVHLIGMNADLMLQYVQFVADRLATSLGTPPMYGVLNPFEWMDMISMDGKTNFFEKRVSEYATAHAHESATAGGFSLNEDF